MRTTTKYNLPVPNSDNDVDDVPSQLGAFADQVDSLITNIESGSLAAMPKAGILDRFYFVNVGDGKGQIFHDTGSVWELANAISGAQSDISTMGYGDAPALGSPAKGWAPADHVHGSQSNPVIPHVEASDPHPGYNAGILMTKKNTKTLPVPNNTPTNVGGFDTVLMSEGGITYTDPGKFQVSLPGVYRWEVTLAAPGSNNSNPYLWFLRSLTNNVDTGAGKRQEDSSSHTQSLTAGGPILLAANDIVTIQFLQQSGAVMNVAVVSISLIREIF